MITSEPTGLRKPVILAIGAHPDDCEFKCGGVAALWAQRGYRVCFASVTNGQSGHHEMGLAQLVQRRMNETRAAAETLGVEWRILPVPDGHLEPTLDHRLMLIRLIREYQPDLILTHRPNDYHPDHRYTSVLVQDAAFLLTVPKVAPEAPAMRQLPVIMHFPDAFRKPAAFAGDVVIDTDPVFSQKIRALHQHASQVYEWLPWLEGTLDQVPTEDKDRLEWLRKWYAAHSGPTVSDAWRTKLVERYGLDRGSHVRQAEAFELCEYGSPLDLQRAQRLFGGL